jgi:transcriptional regulator with XRE-family HTH domain
MPNHNVINLDLIKELRIKNGISTEEMSVKLGYEGYQGYYYKERGIRRMSVEDIAKISRILNVPIQKLFFRNKVTEKVTKEVV